MAERKHRGRVTGLGGIFFKAKDPKAMAQWYTRHLGMDIENSMVLFSWRGGREGKVEGHTVWSIFPADTKYFGEDGASFMVNYRVKDLDAVLASLQREGGFDRTGAAGLRARSVRLGHGPGRKSDRAVGASEDIPGSGDRDDDGVRTYHGMRLPSR